MRYLLLGLLMAAAPVGAKAENRQSDEDAVKAAVLDYVDAFYNVKPELAKRSVAEDLNKFGHSYEADGSSTWPTMSYQQLVDLAGRYNVNGRVPADAPKKIEILGMGRRIANAKLVAQWGVDYLLLTKDADDKWRIRQVLWEGNPPKAKIGGTTK
jgi:hypothetical protein